MKSTKISRAIYTFVLSSLLLISFIGGSYALDFSIDLATDKPSYSLGESVNIMGMVLYNGTPLINELVGLQVDHLGALNPSIIYRTSFTSVAPPGLEADLNGDGVVDILDIVIVAAAFGSSPGAPNWDVRADLNGDSAVDIIDMVKVSGTYGDTGLGVTWLLQILDVYVADLAGYQVSQVRLGGQYTVYVRFRNNQYFPIFTHIAFTIYDANNHPIFSFTPFTSTVQPGEPYVAMSTWDVPSDAALGQAAVYASAFSEKPSLGGYPYCPEKSKTFSIVSSLGLTRITENPETLLADGEFNSSFRIMNNSSWQGTYVAYATSFHKAPDQPYGSIATNSTDFDVGP